MRDISLYILTAIICSIIMFIIASGKKEYQMSYEKKEGSYLHGVTINWINKEDGIKISTNAQTGRILYDERKKRIFIIVLWNYRTEYHTPNSKNRRVVQGKQCRLEFRKKDLSEIIIMTIFAGLMGLVFAYFMKNLFFSPVRIYKSGKIKFKNKAYQNLYDKT